MTDASRLPRPLSGFVGRKSELAEVSKLLGTHRLVTMTGEGGAGKTRLAIELGRKVEDRFPDGAFLVDLAPVRPGGLIPARIAAACEVPERPGVPVMDAVDQHLRSAAALVILDNCEHLAEEASDTARRLLEGCGELSIVATSRTPLEVPGEVVWRIPPLSLPPPGGEAPTESDAVRLFAQRAAARVAGYELSERPAGVVAEICRRLDGMPLAIELASSWVGILGESEILERVAGELGLLEGRGPARPDRHRTIAAAIAWSHDLLEQPARTLFARLSVFRGTFDLAAAEAVAGGHVLGPLSALVSHSLVVAEIRAESPTRYRLLETVRQFAAATLDPGSEAEVRRRHARHFLEIAERAEAVRDTLDAVGWMKRLIEDADNLRTGLEWLIRFEPDHGVQMAGALGWLWEAIGNAEGRIWLKRALEASPTKDRYRSRACDWLGWMEINLGNYAAAEAPLRAGLEISEELGDKAGIARAYTGLAPMIRMAGDNEAGFRLAERGLTLAREAGDRRIEGGALTTLGALHLDEGDPDKAIGYLKSAIGVQRQSGNLTSFAMACLFTGVARWRVGDPEAALAAIEDAVSAFGKLESTGSVAVALEVLAMIDERLDLPSRIRLSAAAQAISDRTGMSRPPFWGQDLREWRRRAAEQIGARWEALWAQGASLTIDEALRIARGAPSVEASPQGWEKLSRREREVAALVAEGLSNAQIAARLFISERTAESHVGSILSRLGFRSRSQVAARIGRTT